MHTRAEGRLMAAKLPAAQSVRCWSGAGVAPGRTPRCLCCPHNGPGSMEVGMRGEIRGDSEGVASGPTTKPSNFVARVIDDRAELEPALEELLAAGVARESVAILQGERGADAISRRGARGLKTWLLR